MNCYVIDCTRTARNKGLCKAHHMRRLRGMSLDGPLRARGLGARTTALIEAAWLAESMGAADVAKAIAEMCRRKAPVVAKVGL